jgi:hypothetical protein
MGRFDEGAARKHFPGQPANFSSLVNDGLCSLIRLGRKFRFVNSQVEALEALPAGHES